MCDCYYWYLKLFGPIWTVENSVWPDVRLQRSPMSPKCYQKSSHISFYSQSDVFKTAKLSPNIWATFRFKKICHQKLLKIAQSGHTVWHWPKMQICQKLRNATSVRLWFYRFQITAVYFCQNINIDFYLIMILVIATKQIALFWGFDFLLRCSNNKLSRFTAIEKNVPVVWVPSSWWKSAIVKAMKLEVAGGMFCKLSKLTQCHNWHYGLFVHQKSAFWSWPNPIKILAVC